MGESDCFRDAYEYFMGIPESESDDYKLVHGTVLLTFVGGKQEKHDHAWLEMGDKFVIDPSPCCLGNSQKISKIIYYLKNHVQKRTSHKYDVLEATEKFLAVKNYGPWHRKNVAFIRPSH